MDYFTNSPCNLFTWDVRDKPNVKRYYVTKFLRQSNRMFKYENLPDTITPSILEWYLQSLGFLIAVKHNDKVYILNGTFGGEPNHLYLPTIAIINNPYLDLNKEFKIDEDCVLVKNDSMLQGVIPLYARYATLRCENDITLNIASINTRISQLLSADDDRAFNSSKKYLEDIENGKLGVIGENSFITDGIKVQPTASSANSNLYTQLCEYDRYLDNSLAREIGLGATVNLKRENVSEMESQQDDDTLLPVVDDMLLCRQEAIEQINNMFDTNITVSLNSAWKNRRDETKEESEEVLEDEVQED